MITFKRIFTVGVFLLLLPLLAPAQSLQLADSLYQKGKNFDNSGNMKQSEFYYREAYNIYRDFQDTASWLQAGKEYASAMMWRSKNEQAMELYQKLLKVEHPANDAYNRGDLYNSMGLLSRRTGNIERAQKYYQQSLPLAKQSADSLLLGVVYSNLGGVHEARGHYSQAMERYKQSIPYFKGINQPENVAISLGNIADIYSGLSLYDKALEFYNRSLTIHENVGNIHYLAGAYNSLANVQRELGNYDQALVSYKKSLEFSKKAGTPNRTATVLNNIGLLYKTLGEHDKALDYYQQSLAISKETSGPTNVAVTNNNIGQLFWDQGEREKAGSYYEKSYELRKQVGNPYEISVALNTMVKWHLDQDKYDEARDYANQLQTIGDTTNSYNILKTASTYFGQIDNKLGNPQSALGHFKKANVAPRNKLVEFKTFEEEFELGKELKFEDYFNEGQFIDVTGVSKGKGFQGVVKRHNFSGVGETTHGQKDQQRAPGSVGGASDPSRVFKGKKMAGRTGNNRVKVENLRILKIYSEENLVLLGGSVPGSNDGYLIIER